MQIYQIYKIEAAPSQVWKALTDPKEINEWGGGPAIMSAEEGAEFSLWDGDIYGKNIKVEKEKLLVQEWYGNKEWQKPSIVEFKISSESNITTIKLSHNGIPDDEVADFAAGWQDYYMGAIKVYLES